MTTTTSTPARCSVATSSQTRATTDSAQLARLVGDDGGAELDDGDGHAAKRRSRTGPMRAWNSTCSSSGPGPRGQKAAIQAAKLGKRVAVAERRDRLGGVSIHTGTIPSKTLREAVLDQLAERPLDVLDPTRMEEPSSRRSSS